MNKEWQIVIEFFGFKSKYSQPEVDGSTEYISRLLKPLSQYPTENT